MINNTTEEISKAADVSRYSGMGRRICVTQRHNLQVQWRGCDITASLVMKIVFTLFGELSFWWWHSTKCAVCLCPACSCELWQESSRDVLVQPQQAPAIDLRLHFHVARSRNEPQKPQHVYKSDAQDKCRNNGSVLKPHKESNTVERDIPEDVLQLKSLSLALFSGSSSFCSSPDSTLDLFSWMLHWSLIFRSISIFEVLSLLLVSS